MSIGSSTDDELIVLVVGVLGFGAVAGSVGVLWQRGWDWCVGWLVTHQVLLADTADPWLALPGFGGAGVDGHRVAIAAAVVLAVSAWLVSGVRRRAALGGEVPR